MEDYLKAHEEGIKAENKVNGSTRGTDGASTLTTDYLNRQTGSKNFNYTQNGNSVVVTVNVVKSNVTSISSKVQNPTPEKKTP